MPEKVMLRDPYLWFGIVGLTGSIVCIDVSLHSMPVNNVSGKLLKERDGTWMIHKDDVYYTMSFNSEDKDIKYGDSVTMWMHTNAITASKTHPRIWAPILVAVGVVMGLLGIISSYWNSRRFH